MHDDIPLTVGRATRVLRERIQPAVHALSVPLTAEWHELPGEPVPPAEALALPYQPYAVGTPWGRAWSTSWFRLTGQVPEQWRGHRVEAVLDLGFDPNMTGFQCEGLVYLRDGEPLKALNPRSQWVLVTESATGGESVELFVEAAANPVLLDYQPFLPTREGDVLTSSPRRLYTTRRLDLAVFDTQLHELALDIEVLLELQAELPDSSSRRMRILQALDDALDALRLQDLPGTAAAARETLAEVLAQPAEPSAHRLAAVGHAHIDSAWLWPVRETVRKVARTAASMTRLIQEEPGFLFGMSSAQQYRWLQEHRPEVYARVKAAVAEGRFVPLGGMWVESDTVMPTGEALARQFLYGQSFFRREFGVSCRGVWLPDSFGYSPQLPQLMRRAGFDWFFTQKISWNQVNRFPHHSFAWEGIDGSRIFSHFPPMDTYNSQLSGAELARAARQFRESRRASGSIAPVGWGDGGGGTTREMTGKARRLAALEGSARVRWEHPDAFFERAKAELPEPPVWVGELYLELHRGTLTSQHRTKQGNRLGERLLVEAELWAATAAVRTGLEYPHEELDALWELLLLHQFHDILPGTSIAWVHREAVQNLARVAAGAEAVIARSLDALAGEGELPLLFNAAPFPRRGAPALGAASPQAPGGEVVVVDGERGIVLRNELVEVTVSRDGLIVSAIDRATGREAIAAGGEANLLQLHEDFPNMWDAWDVDRFYRNRCEELRTAQAVAVEPLGSGASVVVERSFGSSRVRQVLSLQPGSRVLRIDQSTDWHETEKLLKVAFPLDVSAEHTAAETQFGFHKRVTHTNTSWEAAKFETSLHRFVLAEEPGFGVALITDSSYGYDVSRESTPERGVTTTLRLSLLRAPRFPDPETDQGLHSHSFGLVIGTDALGATEEGIALGAPLRERAGTAPVQPLVAVEGEGILVSSVKLAHDRSGELFVRVYEAQGRRARGVLRVDAPFVTVRLASLIEDELDGQVETIPSPSGVAVPISLTPFEVRGYRLSVS